MSFKGLFPNKINFNGEEQDVTIPNTDMKVNVANQ